MTHHEIELEIERVEARWRNEQDPDIRLSLYSRMESLDRMMYANARPPSRPQIMKLLTYLGAAASFGAAGLCFGAQPTGAWGPLLCGVGMIFVLWRANAVR